MTKFDERAKRVACLSQADFYSFRLPTRLGISYSTAKDFTFKSPEKKFGGGALASCKSGFVGCT